MNSHDHKTEILTQGASSALENDATQPIRGLHGSICMEGWKQQGSMFSRKLAQCFHMNVWKHYALFMSLFHVLLRYLNNLYGPHVRKDKPSSHENSYHSALKAFRGIIKESSKEHPKNLGEFLVSRRVLLIRSYLALHN